MDGFFVLRSKCSRVSIVCWVVGTVLTVIHSVYELHYHPGKKIKNKGTSAAASWWPCCEIALPLVEMIELVTAVSWLFALVHS